MATPMIIQETEFAERLSQLTIQISPETLYSGQDTSRRYPFRWINVIDNTSSSPQVCQLQLALQDSPLLMWFAGLRYVCMYYLSITSFTHITRYVTSQDETKVTVSGRDGLR